MGLLNLLRGKKKPKVEIIKATDNDISNPGHKNSSSHRKHPDPNVEHVRKSAREREEREAGERNGGKKRISATKDLKRYVFLFDLFED